MDNISLSTFAPALARLLLCGGGGLPAAWGPLHHLQTHEADTYPWDPVIGKASGLPGYLYDDGPRIECWSLPLDPASPWPARMAVVAAWMLAPDVGDVPAATIAEHRWRSPGDNGTGPTHTGHTTLYLLRPDAPMRVVWTGREGSVVAHRAVFYPLPAYDLPTLVERRRANPVAAALLLALYDVPEIKARVEALR